MRRADPARKPAVLVAGALETMVAVRTEGLHELEAAAAAASSTKHPANNTALSKHPTTAVPMHQATDSSTAPESIQLAVQVQDRHAESPTATVGGHALGQQHHPDKVDPTASIRLPTPDHVERPGNSRDGPGANGIQDASEFDLTQVRPSWQSPPVMLAVQPPAAVREVKEEWQQRLESQIAELRRQLESDAQERTQMLVAAAARARALEPASSLTCPATRTFPRSPRS